MSDKTADELRDKLTPEQYHVTQECGTEPPFSGRYWNYFADGTYRCVVCGTTLFRSENKFASNCGWPSFEDVAAQGCIKTQEDYSHGMHRTEVLCGNCGAHLGHVFPDGPTPTGLRYCINSAAIDFTDTSEK